MKLCLFVLVSEVLSCVPCVDVGVSSTVLVSRQDEAWSADPPHRRRSPLPPIGIVSDLRLQQSPLRERRQQVSHPGKGSHGFAECWIYAAIAPQATPPFASEARLL